MLLSSGSLGSAGTSGGSDGYRPVVEELVATSGDTGVPLIQISGVFSRLDPGSRWGGGVPNAPSKWPMGRIDGTRRWNLDGILSLFIVLPFHSGISNLPCDTGYLYFIC